MTLKKGYHDEPASTAPASSFSEATTRDFPPFVLAGGTATGDGLDLAGKAQNEAIDIL
jgi:hypothetical protein